MPSGTVRLGLDVPDHSTPSIHPKDAADRSIDGTFCTLTPLSAVAHGDDLFHAYSLDKVDEMWNFMNYGPWKTAEEYKKWIEVQTTTKDNEYFFAIIDRKTKKAVGVCAYLRVECNSCKSIEVGNLAFSKLMQRSAIGSECLIMLIKRAFLELKFRRVEWKCNVLNMKSMTAARRLGFTFEGYTSTYIHLHTHVHNHFLSLYFYWPTFRRSTQCHHYKREE